MDRNRPWTILEYLFWCSVYFSVLTAFGLIALLIFTHNKIPGDLVAVAIGVPSFFTCVLGLVYFIKKKFGDEKDTEALDTTVVKKESFEDKWNRI